MKTFVSRLTAALLLAVMILSSFACGESSSTPAPSADAPSANNEDGGVVTAEEETTEDIQYNDNLGSLDFGGKEFRIRTIQNQNVHNAIDSEEQTGDTYNDALYLRNRAIEERFNTKIVETIAPDNNGESKIILAGEDAFETTSVRCPAALTMWEDGLLYSFEKIPNVDLTQPYWSQSLNDSISLANQQYVAIGAFDMNVYDLTYCLLFNKKIAADYSLGDFYGLVGDGKFTMDKMSEQMQAVLMDVNGDNEMDVNDQWGYLANSKQVLPDFWIAAGEKSIMKDENDLPYNNMTSERFHSVFIKTFEIMYDTGVYFSKLPMDADVGTEAIRLFSSNQSLFMDVSLFHIGMLRNMEADFGILPYPKYNEEQKEYYSRVSYYWCCIVPVTNTDLEFTGAMLEALNCESANSVVPAYYEIALKGKFSRDNESEQMLQLIADNRIVDIGDTTMCDKIRDGFMGGLFASNTRDKLESKLASVEKNLAKYIEKIPEQG
ncbi:MAG: hypothetical protein K6D94_00570 [Clostridiales bacterium]|nr:hypothetical protein [Clostridiales bacterium]